MKKNLFTLVISLALLGFGSAQAAYVNVADSTGNVSMATALDLTPYFDKTFDANIERFGKKNQLINISTSFFHASVNATTGTSGSMDWYSFNTGSANTRAYFDIDNTTSLNSWIKLYDSFGTLIGSNNNRSTKDSGTTVTTDSYLSKVLTNPGLYFVSVGRAFKGDQASLNAGQGYALHVSLNSAPVSPAPTAVPVPATAWLFGSAFAGLMISFNRKEKGTPAMLASC